MKKQPRKPAKKTAVKPAKKKKKTTAKKASTNTAAGRYKSSDFKQTVVTLEADEMATICNALEHYKANRLLAAFLAQRK